MTFRLAPGSVTPNLVSCYLACSWQWEDSSHFFRPHGNTIIFFITPPAASFVPLSHDIVTNSSTATNQKENQMKSFSITLITTSLLLATVSPGVAHFGMVIPTEPIVTPEKRTIQLDISFSHPFEGIGMDMVKPAKFSVIKDGEKTDLLPGLQESKVMEHQAWKSDFQVKRPGVYHFVMEPTPYWEPTEDLSIIHYTKTIIPAFGSEDGWDQPVGLPTEIVPLLRPFGNYAGNSFSGQVLFGNKPVPGAEVEVEFYNKEHKFTAASDYHITQVVKADAEGIFSFTCPQPGWWGFAALSSANYTLKNPQGEEKAVELGAVLWVYMDPWQ